MYPYSNLPANPGGIWQIDDFGGLDCAADSTRIKGWRSPELQNFYIDKQGALAKRPGWESCWETPLFDPLDATLSPECLFWCPQSGGLLFVFSKVLYHWQRQDAAPTALLSGLTSSSSWTSFRMNGKTWLLGGGNYICTDGSTADLVSPYLPLLFRNIQPDGTGGSEAEAANLLNTSARLQYSADGTSTAYFLPEALIGASLESVSVDGTATNAWSYDAARGKIIFSSAPAAGMNKIEIQISSTALGADAARIKNCSIAHVYGGANDSRVFLSGNSSYPNTDWASALYDPSYFPVDGFTEIGDESDPIRGYAAQFDEQLIFTAEHVWVRKYSLDADGHALFPVSPIQNTPGPLNQSAVQLLDNDPAWLAKTGLESIHGGAVRDERKLRHLSGLVDKRLLAETALADARCFEWRNYFGIALNGRLYLYDHRLEEWFLWTHIPAGQILSAGGELWFSDTDSGMVYVFKDPERDDCYSDDGEAIDACWQSPDIDFDAPQMLKQVDKLFLTLSPESRRSSATVEYISDRSNWKSTAPAPLCLFDWNDCDFGNFSFISFELPQVFTRRLHMRRCGFMQLRIRNNVAGEGLHISRVAFHYQLMREERR